jgi:hypothetical protein
MKSETRNSKPETNSKFKNRIDFECRQIRTSNFGFVSRFEFRASDFLRPDLILTPD